MGFVVDAEKKNEEGLDLLMKVPIIWRKLSIFKEIGVIILNPITTSQPITHQPLETMRICLMEEECSRVKDQCRSINKIMFHRVSKDNSIREIIEQTI